METKLRKDYKWLFSKRTFMVVNGKKVWSTHEITPTIVDGGSHWRIYKEKDASPLILSKNYGMV